MSTPAQVWSYRTLIVNLAQRDLRSRYKKSVLGWLWSLINPAATLAIYTMVFSVFLRAQPPVAGNGTMQNFAVYLFCGLIVWNVFSGVINGCIGAFATAGSLLTRTYFPPECPLLASLATVLLQGALETIILFALLIALGNFSWTAIVVLPVLLLAAAAGLGIGMVLALLNIRFRDVNYLVGIGLQIAFYMTPIVYPIEAINSQTAKDWLQRNPLTSYVYSMRQGTYMLDLPTAGNWAVMLSLSSVCLVGGWLIFHRHAHTVIEEL